MFRPMSLSRMATPALLMAAIIGCPAGAVGLQPLTSAFTYQGELGSAGAPASGTYDIRFRLYDAVTGGVQIGGTVCSDNLAVEAGRFSASLDFGAVFTGQKRFLEIEVRADTGLGCGDESGYTVLSPRQELTAVPNATFAQTAGTAIAAQTASNATSLNGQPASFFANAANLTGTLADARLSSNVARLDGSQTFTGQTSFSNPANTFSGIFSGNGAGLLNLNGASIAAGTITRSRMGADVESVLSQWTSVPPTAAPLDAIAWGFNLINQTNVPALPSGVTYTDVAGGGNHSLALRSDGTVVAWGFNNAGQTNVPALPSGVTYTAVAGGGAHSLALRSDGTAVAWGFNSFGQTNVPALPSGVTYTAVAGGEYHSLALRSAVSPPRLSSPLAVAASSFVGSGAALTNLNAANLTGTLAADRIPNLDASKITSGALGTAQIPDLEASKITTGTLDNARTSGTNLNTPSTLVLRDDSGNFSAGTITANLNGNAATATTATNATNATNATQLNGQPASFYTDAAHLTGTLDNARTSGTNLNTPSTLVLRDASGNFSAGTITANLNGNAATATSATNATNATNATQLNGQPASFYTNAANLTGTLADARLSPNVVLLSNVGPSQFAGAVGIGIAPTGGARLQVIGYDAAVVDQSQLDSQGAAGSTDQWQSFTAGLTGRLSGVRLRVSSPQGNVESPGTIQIYAGEGTSGQLLATQQVTYPVGVALRQFDFSAPVDVTAGSVYTIRFSAPTVPIAWVHLSTANPYAGGRMSFNSSWDAVFETLVRPAGSALAVSESGVSIGRNAPPPAINGLSVAGAVSAASFSGSGAGLTNINASNIS
ncbi:MAG: hypothetical protein ACK51N_01320, partial [bacterium]